MQINQFNTVIVNDDYARVVWSTQVAMGTFCLVCVYNGKFSFLLDHSHGITFTTVGKI